MAEYARDNPRHKILVEYTAYGKSPEEIAQITSYAVGYVRAIQNSPLFKTEVAQAQLEIKQNTLKIFAERLAEETLPSLETIVGIRDNPNARDADRVTAADKVIGRALDLYVPRNRDKDGEKRTTRLIIEGNDLTQLMHAVREAEGKSTLEIAAPCAERDNDPLTETTEAVIQPVEISDLEAQDESLRRWA